MTQVQLADALHILIGQREVEHIEVLLHTLLADGLRDDNHAALDEIAQGGLCRTFVILGTDGYQLSKPQHYPKNIVFYSVNHSVIG